MSELKHRVIEDVMKAEKEKFMTVVTTSLADRNIKFKEDLTDSDIDSVAYEVATNEVDSKDELIIELVSTLYDFAWGPLIGDELGNPWFNMGTPDQKLASDKAKEVLAKVGFVKQTEKE